MREREVKGDSSDFGLSNWKDKFPFTEDLGEEQVRGVRYWNKREIGDLSIYLPICHLTGNLKKNREV